MLKFSPPGWMSTTRYLGGMAAAERERLDMTGLLQRLAAAGVEVAAVAVGGPWGDVDSAADLAIYEQDIQAGRLVA